MKRPTDSPVITLPYGATSPSPPYSKSNPHAGVDYRAPTGANIYAPHSGKVTVAGSLGTCGLAVDIDAGKFKSRLCHNSQLLVSVGQQVNEGQVVAKAGSTGAAQGAHCHFVLWDNGVRVDGSKYVTVGIPPDGGGGDMATDTQIDKTISYNFQIGFGRAPTDADFNTWRPLFKNNYAEAELELMRQIDISPAALKNKTDSGENSVELGPGLYRVKKEL